MNIDEAIAKIEDIGNLVEGADLVLCESTHIDVGELLDLVSRKKVKSTVLTHIHEGLEKDRERINMISQKLDYHNLSFAYDGFCIDIS